MIRSHIIASVVVILIMSCSDNKNGSQKLSSILPNVTALNSPAGDSCAEPYLFTDKNGTLYLSWIEKRNKESKLCYSVLVNDIWSDPVVIAAGNNWFVNWADYPVVSSDGSQHLIAHFLEKSDTAKFAYDIKVTSSIDGGKTWSNPKTLHDDAKKAEHGFVSIIPFNDQFFITWLDGRKTASEEGHGGHSGHGGEMTLRAAFMDKNGNKTNEWELDDKICDCCQTTAAITNEGPVVVYRDRSDEEIRDMSIVRFINGSWTKPKRIHEDNWQIKACPVNGPRVDAINNDLAIAWFSMKDKKGEVKIIFSNNGGETFSKAIHVDEGKAIGRVDVAMLDSSSAVVSWLEGSSIKFAKIHSSGTKEPSINVAPISEKRSSGFPQMSLSGNKLFFAWTDDVAKTIRVGVITL
jgi:hypothetical protein